MVNGHGSLISRKYQVGVWRGIDYLDDVNETEAFSECVASGRCPVNQQRRPGRHPAAEEQRQWRLGWSKEGAINQLQLMDDLKLYGAWEDQLDSLIQVVRIFSQDIKMSFGLGKCAFLELRRGRQVGSSSIDLPDEQLIREVEEEGYKYLGISQLGQILNTQMKGRITSEYIRTVKKLCRSKLNGGNLIRGVNAWAVGVVRYKPGILEWTVIELASMDRKTRKILAMNGCLHTRSNVVRLYLPRNVGARGLTGIEERVRRESKSFHGYLRESTE